MSNITPITMPKWGIEMSEGTVTNWHLEDGTPAQKGLDLVDIETEKIVNTLDLQVEGGVLRRKLAEPGTVVPVGGLIAVFADKSVSEADIDAFIASYQAVDASFEPKAEEPEKPAASAQAVPTAATSPEPATPAVPQVSKEELAKHNAAVHATPMARVVALEMGIDLREVKGTGRNARVSQADVEAAASARGIAPRVSPLADRAGGALAGPSARKTAREMGIDIDGVSATGAKGRVTKEDVLRAGSSAAPASAQSHEDVAMSPMRKSIAQVLLKAKQNVPHFYATVDIEMDAVLELRSKLNARANATAKISVNDFIVKAAAAALAAEPDVNVHVLDGVIRKFAQADISIAVAIEGGLLTPVVRNVGAKDLTAIARESAALAEKARKREIGNDDVRGATFTVSNLGMFGIRQFDAIINPPQAAILAVGGSRREPVEIKGGGVGFRSMMSVTLSSDHRAIDGALAARYLAALRGALEDPYSLLLS